MKEKEDNIMTTENESVRAAGVTKMTTSILVGMCANPEFWIDEGKKLGVPADQPSVVVLAAVALEQAETLIRVLIAAQQAREENNARAADTGANDEQI